MPNPEISHREVHKLLTTGFTDEYIRRNHLSRVARSIPYDPTNPICDYDKTWWEAQPNKWSNRVPTRVVSLLNRMRPSHFNETFIAPLRARADELTDALHQYPVMFVNGHAKGYDLQAGLPTVAATAALAREAKSGNYQANLERMVRLSHGFATRALAPIEIGFSNHQPQWTFLRIIQLAGNPHWSFPINKRINESGIPASFRHEHNAKMKADALQIVAAGSQDKEGLQTLWTMSPAGTPDVLGVDEHEGKVITKSVEQATIDFVSRMGVGLLPVYTVLGKGILQAEFGSIIPPNEVTQSTLASKMADLAEYRRVNGQPNVYYEGELTA